MREAGKGDKQRPTDHDKFSAGYDLIWGKKKPQQEPQHEQPTPEPVRTTPQS